VRPICRLEVQREGGVAVGGTWVGVIPVPHGLTHEAQRPSSLQPSSMILPLAQSRTAHTGSLRLCSFDGQPASAKLSRLAADKMYMGLIIEPV
jgi:hypothetical protein